jgi:hypothetical protein
LEDGLMRRRMPSLRTLRQSIILLNNLEKVSVLRGGVAFARVCSAQRRQWVALFRKSPIDALPPLKRAEDATSAEFSR